MQRPNHDWAAVDYSLSNQALAALLGCRPETVSRKRGLHARRRAPSRRSSGHELTAAQHTALVCARSLLEELATSGVRVATLTSLAHALGKLQGEMERRPRVPVST